MMKAECYFCQKIRDIKFMKEIDQFYICKKCPEQKMKVYILIIGDPDADSYISGVYKTKLKAEKAWENLEYGSARASIEDYGVE